MSIRRVFKREFVAPMKCDVDGCDAWATRVCPCNHAVCPNHSMHINDQPACVFCQKEKEDAIEEDDN